MGVSLKDIADKLQLSKTTISWVLSGKGEEKGISAETQRRVVACARKLAYEPNLLARSLNTGVSKTIGLILPSISDSFYSHIAQQVEMNADQAGYSLMIASSNSEIERENAMIRVFRAKKVDGMIIAPTKISKREIIRLSENNYPLVLFDRFFPELSISNVIIDNEQSSYKLVQHLIDKGCRRIAVITTNPHLLTMDMRREGYADALSDAGLPNLEELYGVVPYVGYPEHVRHVLDRIFAKVPNVDGFFFTTHILAVEALRYFYDRGIAVGDDGLKLACMHEDALFRVLAPRMSIAHFPVDEIGRSAVQMLLEQINARREVPSRSVASRSQVIPCHIEYRD